LELEEALKEVEEHLRDVPELPRGTVARWMRDDRGKSLIHRHQPLFY